MHYGMKIRNVRKRLMKKAESSKYGTSRLFFEGKVQLEGNVGVDSRYLPFERHHDEEKIQDGFWLAPLSVPRRHKRTRLT